MKRKILLSLSAVLLVAVCGALFAACGGHPHALTAVEAHAAGCTEAGNTAYWSCEECGKYFSDAAGKQEIEEGSWVIPPAGDSYADT